MLEQLPHHGQGRFTTFQWQGKQAAIETVFFLGDLRGKLN
jgi:hypothetical protein